jgi:hypothetical protein
MRRLLPLLLIVLVTAPALGQHGLGAREQWQPQTARDERLQQPVEIEILGRAAVPALELLSEQTGVSLGVAPEDLTTVGERKLSIFAHGCTLKDIMVQLPEALRECHWDIDASGDPPVYLLHRNAGADHTIASLSGRSAQTGRAARQARVEAARRALEMSAEELAELEKTDIFLARSVQEPQARLALEAFLSLPAAKMDEFLSAGRVNLKYSDASPELQTAIDQLLRRNIEEVESAGMTSRPEAEWRPALRDTTVTFSYGPRGTDGEDGAIEVRFFVALTDPRSFGSAGGHVVPPRHPSGRYVGMGPRPSAGRGARPGGRGPSARRATQLHRLLLETGTSDFEEADRIVRGAAEHGLQSDAEQTEQRQQQQWQLRDDPDLQRRMVVGRPPMREFAEFQMDTAAETGISIISDYFTGVGGSVPMELRGEEGVPLWLLAYLTAERYDYTCKKAGTCLVFHHAKWYDLVSAELPESVIFPYVREYHAGELQLDDVVDLASTIGEDRLRYRALPTRVRHSFHYPSRWALLLYVSLTPEQRQQVRGPEGLPVAAMTEEQRERVVALALNPELILPHSRDDFAAAVFRIEESREQFGTGNDGLAQELVRLLLEFPDGTLEGGSVRLRRFQSAIMYAPLVHAQAAD